MIKPARCKNRQPSKPIHRFRAREKLHRDGVQYWEMLQIPWIAVYLAANIWWWQSRREKYCGLIGPNGIGKTTLLKWFSRGILKLTKVHVKGWKCNNRLLCLKTIHLGFWQRCLNPDLMDGTMGQEGDRRTNYSWHLGSFTVLSKNDYRKKSVKVMSVWARSYVVCKMMLQNQTVLWWIEPTNHMDMEWLSLWIIALITIAGYIEFFSHETSWVCLLCDSYCWSQVKWHCEFSTEHTTNILC